MTRFDLDKNFLPILHNNVDSYNNDGSTTCDIIIKYEGWVKLITILINKRNRRLKMFTWLILLHLSKTWL